MRAVFSTWLERAQYDALNARGAQRRLLSFGIIAKPTGRQAGVLEDYMKGTDLELMLDSGAYTAWKQGTPIRLKDYIDFILKYKDAWTTVVNLDVIPGKPNQTPTPAEAERAADEGWDNYYQLRDALKSVGVVPIHVFHRGDDFKHLKRLVDECEFFGLAPKTDGTTDQRRAWLEQCMPYVTDKVGMPTRKLHGFAVTALDLMRRYPWYSVDSTSWIMMGRFGGCFIPLSGREEPLKLGFSAKSPKKDEQDAHFDTLRKTWGLDTYDWVVQYLLEHGVDDPRKLRDNYCLTCGAEFEGNLREDEPLTCCKEPQGNIAYMRRDELNIDYFLDEEKKNAEVQPWRPLRAPGLF